METIKNIKDVGDGFEIKTNKQTISLLLKDNDGGCCEIPGTLLSEDDTSKFIGSQILSIEEVDEQLKVYPVLDNLTEDEDRGTVTVFINISTTVGLLQFVAYNNHNGYYGHPVVIRSKQLKLDQTI